MRIEEHLAAYQEHRDSIFKWSLEIQGLEKSQRTIGLNASRGIIELLAIFLHKHKLIDEGFQLNHRWFKSAHVAKRLPEFKDKKRILNELVALENLCENLAYGTQKPVEATKKAVESFKALEANIQRLE